MGPTRCTRIITTRTTLTKSTYLLVPQYEIRSFCSKLTWKYFFCKRNLLWPRLDEGAGIPPLGFGCGNPVGLPILLGGFNFDILAILFSVLKCNVNSYFLMALKERLSICSSKFLITTYLAPRVSEGSEQYYIVNKSWHWKVSSRLRQSNKTRMHHNNRLKYSFRIQSGNGSAIFNIKNIPEKRTGDHSPRNNTILAAYRLCLRAMC